MSRHSAKGPSHGQAMVELMVGMVVLLALVAGLLQVAELTRIDTDTMVEARREAGEKAVTEFGEDVDPLTDPDYIGYWYDGDDGRSYTRDDEFDTGDVTAFDNQVVDRAAPDSDHWALLDGAPEHRLSDLHGHPDPASVFGLVDGTDKRTVPLLSAVQSLLYRADHIDLETRVWMTRTGDIY